MKRLTTLLLGTIFLVGCATTGLPRNLNIPKRFQDYRNSPSYYANMFMGDQPILGRYFDIDGDWNPDAAELYLIMDGQVAPYPSFYWFDLNGDTEVDNHEIMYDLRIDGLNGNEEWFKKVNGTNGNKGPIGIA